MLLEQLASDLIYELFDGSYQADQVKGVSQKLVSWFPELVGFHPDVLYAVVAVHAQGVFGDHFPQPSDLSIFCLRWYYCMQGFKPVASSVSSEQCLLKLRWDSGTAALLR